MYFIYLALWKMDTLPLHGTFHIAIIFLKFDSYICSYQKSACISVIHARNMSLTQGSDDRKERMVGRGNLVFRGLSNWSWLRYFGLGT